MRRVLAWMDLEMTGLDATRHTIVEIATVITDDDLQVIAEGPDLVVQSSDAELAAMDDFVRAMHTRSGLLAAVGASTVSLAEAGRQTLEFLQKHIPEPRTALWQFHRHRPPLPDRLSSRDRGVAALSLG